MSKVVLNNRTAMLAGVPIFIAAINMRAGITVINPLIPILKDQYHLSSFQLSFLSSLPLLCFAASAFLMPLVGKIGNTNRVIASALTLLTAAMVIRAAGNLLMLFVSSLAVGIAIAVLNFSLPVWVKEHVSAFSGLLTGIYIAVMGIFASLSIAVAVPLAHASRIGWRLSMIPWIIFGFLSAAWWIALNRREEIVAEFRAPKNFSRGLLRNLNAWSISIFFGLQSMLYYGTATWLPTIFVAKGFTLSHAGYAVSLAGLFGSILGIMAPHYASKMGDLRLLLVGDSILIAISFGALIFDHGWHLVFWLFVANIGMAISFPVALLLTVLRSVDASETRSLSIMTQSIGYLMAACAPGIVGAVFDASKDWNIALWIPVAMGLALTGVGLIAGRPGKIILE
jgi:CP family cyanate transporter-like MFS transporter